MTLRWGVFSQERKQSFIPHVCLTPSCGQEHGLGIGKNRDQ